MFVRQSGKSWLLARIAVEEARKGRRVCILTTDIGKTVRMAQEAAPGTLAEVINGGVVIHPARRP